jgi:hypothetical protein
MDVQGLGTDATFTEAYHGHISKSILLFNQLSVYTYADKVMYGGTRGTKYPPRCPLEFMREPPPVYQKETPKIES